MQSNDSNQQVKGITKVILSKGQNIMSHKRTDEVTNRKSRMGNPLPSAGVMPKLTQTEIKRKLANMKFPIVILGKDQLCTTSLQLTNYEPPHLLGLDQHIWPYMQGWYDTNSTKKGNELISYQQKADEISDEYAIPKNKPQSIERKIFRKQIDSPFNKQVSGKAKHLNEEIVVNKKKTQKRPVAPNEIVKVKTQTPKKSKPIHQLKDKLLKLLYKNTSKDVNENYAIHGQGDSSTSFKPNIEIKPPKVSKQVDAATETVMKYELVSENLPRNTNGSPRLGAKKTLITNKQPWAKAKWASDFIEIVIKKIRSGVYYTQENINQYHNTNTGTSLVYSLQVT